MPYPYLTNARGHTMGVAEMKHALGLISDDHRHPRYGHLLDMKIAPNVSVPWREVNGVQVCYLTSADAQDFWNKPKSTTPMRALAKCPECFIVTAASRINQHARVHHAGVRKGY